MIAISRLPLAAMSGLVLMCAMTLPSGAAVGSSGSENTKGLLATCHMVGEEENRGNESHRGHCVSAATGWATAIVAAITDTTARDKAIANVIVDLATLIPPGDARCTEFNNEIAQAVDLIGQASTDHEQVVRIERIAYTIGHCIPQVQTADVPSTPESVSGFF